MEPIKWISGGVGSVSNASVLDNFHENLPFGLSYADLSQAQQTLDSAVLHNSQLSNQALQHAHHHHMQDPNAAAAAAAVAAAYPTMSTSYTPFPILQAAAMQPPQLHQPSVNVTKDSTNTCPVTAGTTANPGLAATSIAATTGTCGPDANDPSAKSETMVRSPRNQLSGVTTAAVAAAAAVYGCGESPNAANDHSFVPVRVTRPPNAFLLFNKEMRRQLKDSNPTMKVAEISKEIGDRWKHLSAAEKERYVNEANSIKETQRALHPNSMYIRRSKAELAKAGHYVKLKRKAMLQEEQQQQKSSSGDDGRLGMLDPFKSSALPGALAPGGGPRKRQRRDKNPAAPKHPLSAYMWYLTEVRPETMQTYPGSTVGQISKLCAERWNTMTEVERMPWHTKAQADKARYAREMQIYASQHDHPMGRGTRQKYRAAAAATAAASAAAAVASAISASSNSTSSIASSPSPSSATATSTTATTPHLSPDHSSLLMNDHHHHHHQHHHHLDPAQHHYHNHHHNQQQQTSTAPRTTIPDQFHHHKHYHHHHHQNAPTSSLLQSSADQDPTDVAAMFPTSRMA